MALLFFLFLTLVCPAPTDEPVAERNLTRHSADDRHPAWSPEGGRIAFTSNRDGNNEIYVMRADGSQPIRLTNSESDDVLPAWSPDGAKIAFASGRDGNLEIYVMGADGSAPARLTRNDANDVWPRWSPDGARFVFFSQLTGTTKST